MADELKAEYWEVSAKKGAPCPRRVLPMMHSRGRSLDSDHNVNELFDRVAAALFEQSILKAEAKKNPTIALPSSVASRTDSAVSDRYVGTSFASGILLRKRGFIQTNDGGLVLRGARSCPCRKELS